jgi:hypothetical protein
MTENPGERAAFANGYDTARSEIRGQANAILHGIEKIHHNMEVLTVQLKTLRQNVLDFAFPDVKSDGAKDVNHDRG